MKKTVLLAFVFSLCVVGLLELQIAYASPYTNINVATAYDMITNGSYPDLVVLDVRTKNEYDNGHIYGAVWIPVSELEARIGELAGHENHEIIVYCASGGRSATASGILDSHNFTKVYNMLGGISAWQTAGYPVWNATVHNVNTTFNYDTIQAAIDAPQTLDGHTILVDAGTYYEHVVVDKPISLIGENRSTTVIDGNGTGNVIVIDITAHHVNITGFTIRNGTNGIFINICDYNIISGNIVTDNLRGIYLYATCPCNPASGNTIRNNIIKNNGYGISLGVAIDNIIYHNNFIKNTEQAYYVFGSYSNVWDNGYPSGGNYWSDYEERYPDAEELDGSGIWNTAYVIDQNNQDRYPLMNPWVYVSPVADAGSDQSVFQGMTVTFDASGSTDDVAIKSYVWTFTDVTPKTLTGIQPQYTFNNVGDFGVTLNVTDYAGKWNIDTMWVNVSKEINPPTTTDDYDDLWHTTDFTITLNATDDLSGVAETYYKINDDLIQNVSTHGQPLITTESANNTLEYWSVDLNDNEETPHHILTDIKLDKTAPSGSILINNDYAYTTSTSVTLTLTYGDATSDVSQVRYSNDGVWDTEPWESPSTTKTWILTAGDGTKTVYYQVRDNAGLVSDTYSDTIILDITPPTISITSPSNGTEVRSSSPTITWNGNDATSGIDHYEIRLDGGSWINVGTNTTYTFTGVGDGSHTVEVKAFDKAGYSQVAAVKFTVNTSLIGGPRYTEELAIIGVIVVIVALATAIYLLKIRKKT